MGEFGLAMIKWLAVIGGGAIGGLGSGLLLGLIARLMAQRPVARPVKLFVQTLGAVALGWVVYALFGQGGFGGPGPGGGSGTGLSSGKTVTSKADLTDSREKDFDAKE